MTRSASTSASAVSDPADDGYGENDFVVAGLKMDGENASVGFFRGAVDVEEVMKVSGVSCWDSRIFLCFSFDFHPSHPYPYPYSCFYSCSCSCSGSCSSLFSFSGSSSPSDLDCVP